MYVAKVKACEAWLLYLAFALVGLACTLVLLLLVWLALHCLAVFLGRGPKVQATPLQETSNKIFLLCLFRVPLVALACSSVGSAVFLLCRWRVRLEADFSDCPCNICGKTFKNAHKR